MSVPEARWYISPNITLDTFNAKRQEVQYFSYPLDGMPVCIALRGLPPTPNMKFPNTYENNMYSATCLVHWCTQCPSPTLKPRPLAYHELATKSPTILENSLPHLIQHAPARSWSYSLPQANRRRQIAQTYHGSYGMLS